MCVYIYCVMFSIGTVDKSTQEEEFLFLFLRRVSVSFDHAICKRIKRPTVVVLALYIVVPKANSQKNEKGHPTERRPIVFLLPVSLLLHCFCHQCSIPAAFQKIPVWPRIVYTTMEMSKAGEMQMQTQMLCTTQMKMLA